MAKPVQEQDLDDLEATRRVVETLSPFNVPDRERIIRWAREKLGMTATLAVGASAELVGYAAGGSGAAAAISGGDTSGRVEAVAPDIKSFVTTKNPRNDTQTAAVVAYFYRFVAPEPERKDAINSTDLLEACRLSGRQRPSRPAQTMINAHRSGVLDKAGSGQYRLNSVGENLVAMVLPGDGEEQPRPSGRSSTKRKTRSAVKPPGRARATKARKSGRK